MKRLLPTWALLLLSAIVVFGLLLWFRLHPSQADQPSDPLAEACETLKQAMGLEVEAGGAETGPPPGGVQVKGVVKGSPADQAGIRPGDRIVACGDQSVWHAYNLLDVISQTVSAGAPVILLVERNGEYRSVMPERRGSAPRPPMGGQGP